MKILITGSSGMLGSDLVDAFSRDKSFEVRGIGRKTESVHPGVYTRLDLNDTLALTRYVTDFKPDVVFHAAAFTKVDLAEDKPQEAERDNAGISGKLAEICNACGAMLVFFSTDYVFTGDKKGEYVESDPVGPLDELGQYGRTKALAEKAIQEKASKFMIFRVTWLYGKHGNSFPKFVLAQSAQGKEVLAVNSQTGRPTWTRDIAEAMFDLLSRKKNLDQYNKNVFHIGNAGTTDWAGFARKILQLTGREKAPLKEVSWEDLQRLELVKAKRPGNSVLSLDKAKSRLGISMRSWDSALRDFLKTEGLIHGA